MAKVQAKLMSTSVKVGQKVAKVAPAVKVAPRGEKVAKKGVLTPRPYLSWSQLSLWEKNREDYRRVYMDGVQNESMAMTLGSHMSKALEDGHGIDDPIIQQGLLLFPRLKKSEFEIKAKCNVCPLLGKIDAFDPKSKNFREYKTGKYPWSQGRVNEHGQITFYCYLIWLKYKKIPQVIYLDWLNTDEKSKDYGRIRSFATVRSMADLIKMHGRIQRAWNGINQMVQNGEN